MIAGQSIVIDLGAVKKRLGRNATFIEADTSEGFSFKKDNLKAGGTGSFSGHVTTRATAYYR